MAENSNNEKQNDIQLKKDNDLNESAKDNQELDDSEGLKNTDDDSQDIKSSDLAKPVLSPESESEKRCTSASNAGESEYESADDEEVKPLTDLQTIKTQQINEEINELKDENVLQKSDSSFEDKENINKSNENNLNETNLVLNSERNEEIPKQNETEFSDNCIQNDSIKDEENNNNCDQKLENSEEKENENNSDNNTETDIFKENNEISNDLTKENKINEPLKETNTNGIEEFVDEEGGREEIADMDDDYEDIDESEECSINSMDNEDMADGDNDDIDAEERQEGDGEESTDLQSGQKDKSLDHDEDKRNPQYIPKRGPFYEHDDRAMAASEVEVSEVTVVQKVEEMPPKAIVVAKKSIETETRDQKRPKKKVWVEGEKWGHDLFREDEQNPKSRDELVNTYGYDIRNEDNPPKARRKRRYTRGPIKYTRQWRDENAYGRGHTSPSERNERKERKEHSDRNERSVLKVESNDDRLPKEKVNNERNYEPKQRENRKESFDKRDSFERKEKPERKEKYSSERKDKYRTHEKSERSHRSEKSNDFIIKKERFRNERAINENRKYDYEESVDRRDKPFSSDDFPELPNNDLRKKINSNQSNQQMDVWKSSHRFSGESDDQTTNEYKTEPMKIIEAIEHNNRVVTHNEPNSPNVVRTLTFENSKYSQRRSSVNYDYEDDRPTNGKTRASRKSSDSMENSGRPIRKSNNNNINNYQNLSHERKESKDNFRNIRNTVRTERTERTERTFVDESNRNIERFYEDDYRNQLDRESNYIIEANVGLQKLTLEDKPQIINRSTDSEQTRPKRYSSLRQQQQRVVPENLGNIAANTQLTQTSDSNHNLNTHQFYDSHTIQTTAFYAETSSPRTTYHTYMSPTATDSGPQSHPTTYMQQTIPQPLQQRYIAQPSAATGAGDTSRYIPTAVPPNVVTASVPTPQMAQSIPQTGPVPPPSQQVIPAPPPGTTYIPSVSFPSGYPQFPPAPPPTHVPPGYPPTHVTAQQPSPHQLAELYRGGVTYYDTQSQQQNTVRQIPQRRPKAAIPIVPPPDPHSSEGDGDKSYVSVNS